MKRLRNIHPGEVLQEEFLKPLGLSAYRLAAATGMPQTRVSQIVHRKRAVSADTALRLSRFFGTTPQFWLGLQTDFDIEDQERKLKAPLAKIPSYRDVVAAG